MYHQGKNEGEGDEKNKHQLDSIITRLQQASIACSSSLERIITGGHLNLNHLTSMPVFEKLLIKIDCVLKKEEIKIIFDAASKDGNCSWRDLIDWGIKNRIDCRSQETHFPQFPPAVQVILYKMLTIFSKMDIDNETGFQYFTKENKEISTRADF